MELSVPILEISDQLFARLQAYATPLVDSQESALTKVFDLADATKKSGSPLPQEWRPVLREIPDLSHTTLKSASVDGKHLTSGLCNWNALMFAVIRQAAKQLPPDTTISDILVANHVTGQKTDHGYKFIPGVGLSVQGQNSNNAWKAIAQLAKATGVKVDAHFYWSNHSKAAKPGEMGRLQA
jgi:hypothetical protein